jgi:hypothetical protein
MFIQKGKCLNIKYRRLLSHYFQKKNYHDISRNWDRQNWWMAEFEKTNNCLFQLNKRNFIKDWFEKNRMKTLTGTNDMMNLYFQCIQIFL